MKKTIMERKLFLSLFLCILTGLLSAQVAQQTPVEFKVTHTDAGIVYIDGGKNAGLAPGKTLTVKRPRYFSSQSGSSNVEVLMVVAQVTVVSVSNTSAMCEVRNKKSDVQRGDTAFLAITDQEQPSRSWAAGHTLNSQPAAVEVTNQPPWEAAQASPVASASLPQANPSAANQPQPAESAPKLLAEAPSNASSNTPPSGLASQASVNVARAPAASAAAPTAVATTQAVAEAPGKTAKTQSVPVAVAPMQPTSSLTAAQNAPTPTAAQNAPMITATQKAPTIVPAVNPTVTTVQSAPSAVPPAVIVPQGVPATSTADVGATQEGVLSQVDVGSGANNPAIKTSFNVKFVAEDAVYIEGGKDAGLEEGMTLSVRRVSVSSNVPGSTTIIADLAVVSVSNTSAVCEVRNKTADIQRGDIALLSQADQDKMVQRQTLSPTRKYPQVISFSEGDPLDEEVREAVPKPPLPEINRGRGRIGLDYTFINNSGAGSSNSTQVGAVVRLDMTRLGGTYWNLNGYWRGRLSLGRRSSAQPQSVYDLLNRTYTIGATYTNPASGWTAGVGRLYLPWATSLDTLDGGYLGRRFGKHTVVGAFAGTAPDPTSFNYNPDRRTAGTFVAFEAGDFDKVRFTSTTGVAVSGIGWREDRQFIFAENGFFYKRFLSIYDATQIDSQRLPTGGKTQGLSRSFATLRVQPFKRLSFDVNHNYFRDVPTFDASLVGTGLLDKFLFQGLSVGSRVELPRSISVYNNFGRSSRSGDAKSSLNQLYGLTFGRLGKTGLRADARYSKFDSSFGQGNYRALSLSRNFSDAFRFEITAGEQKFTSSLATRTNYRLFGSTFDWNLGSHYFFESGINIQRGGQQSFQQWLTTFGYRFDTGKGK